MKLTQNLTLQIMVKMWWKIKGFYHFYNINLFKINTFEKKQIELITKYQINK